ncbi:MAG TPA: ATP-binding cassette domain-containing protein, partial [Usitatibacter sp.]|nr:ATP-binding cassette domain-containing protein [Usitatibacter sp.]
MPDPGLSLKRTTLEAAWELATGKAPEARGDLAEAADSVEAMATGAGMRSRRVLLDARWWRQAGGIMIARVEERRRSPRGPTPAIPNPSLAEGTGWVALVPRLGHYWLRALDDAGRVVQWRVDEEIAARLAPFAFAFHRRFAPRALRARDLLRFAATHGSGDLGLLLVAGFAAGVVGLFTPLATGWLIDHAIPEGAMGSVQAVIAALAVAGVALIALEMLRAFAIMRFESRVGVAVQAALVDRVVSAPAKFFRDFSSGDLAMRMGSVNTIQRTLTASTIGSFVTSLFLFSNLGLMLMYSRPLTLAASSIAVIVVGVSVLFGLARLRVGPQLEAMDGKLSAMQFEVFSAIAKLRACAAESRALERWYARYDEFRSLNGVSARLANWESVALNLLQPGATVLVLWLAWRLSATMPLSTGDFVAFHAALFSLLGGVYAIVSTLLDLVNLKPVWDRARPILETAPEGAGEGNERHEPTGAIELEKVSFAYAEGPVVLEDVDLSIAPGEFVAIVGASGSGKSTLIRLLLGFETPNIGAIRYDGKNLKRLDLGHLRRRIGTVLQGGKLWGGDLLSNIAGAHPISVETASEAARRAGLARDIEAMPMGLYTVVGEGLSTLSGGQRQRLLIARALVADPRIL